MFIIVESICASEVSSAFVTGVGVDCRATTPEEVLKPIGVTMAGAAGVTAIPDDQCIYAPAVVLKQSHYLNEF